MGRAAGVVLVLALAACSPQPPPPPAPAPAPAPIPAPVPVEPDPPAEPWETEKDPVKAKTMKLEVQWRLNPTFTGTKLRFFSSPPALVAMEEREDGTVDAAAGEAAVKAIRLLAEAHGRLLVEAGLPEASLSALGDERIRMMVFRNRESFDRWHERNRMQNPAVSYYARRDRMLMGWPDSLGTSGCVELSVYALRHIFSRHFCEQADAAQDGKAGRPPEGVGWDDHRLLSALAWVDFGLARHFARTVGEGVRGPSSAEEMETLRNALSKRRTWPLQEWIFAERGQIQAQAQVKGWDTGPAHEEAVAMIQGSLLFRYFMEGENGRWRPSILRVIRNEYLGESARPYLMEAFGLVDDGGRALRGDDPKVKAWIREVEAAYLRFFEELK